VCGDDTNCRQGLLCNFGFSPARCKPPQPEGQPCDWHGDCADDLDCSGPDPTRCMVSGSLREGESCGFEDDCAEGLRCNEATSPARCARPGTEGDRCAYGTDCDEALGLGCTEGVCSPKAGADERCHEHEDCADPLRCMFALEPPRCRAPQGVGEPCVAPEDCLSEWCDESVDPPVCAQ
jgi:hypothetical protein